MTKDQGQYHAAADEVTMADIVNEVVDFVHLAFRKWWIYAVLFLVIGGYLGYQAFATPTKYKAKLTFMINEDDGGFPGVSGILGQIGLGNRRGRFNLDKVLELSSSRNIVAKMAMTRGTIGGKDDLLANHIIELYELDEKWAEGSPELAGFRFVSDSIGGFNELERTALLKVFRKIRGGEKTPGLISNEYSEETTILSIVAETIDQDLSMAIVNELYEKLSAFYIGKTIERQQSTYKIVRTKVDSIVTALQNAEVALARFKDQNKNVFLNVDRVRETQLSMEIQKLHLVHGKALENLEIADFSLKNATPFIQEIDRPIGPLEPINASKIKALFIGALISVVLGSAYLLFMRFWRSVRADKSNIE